MDCKRKANTSMFSSVLRTLTPPQLDLFLSHTHQARIRLAQATSHCLAKPRLSVQSSYCLDIYRHG